MIYIKVRELATEQGFTVGDLAQKAHIRASLLFALWQNPTKIIDTYMLNKLATALNVRAQKLIVSVDQDQDMEARMKDWHR